MFQAQVAPPKPVCAVHEPPGGWRKNLNSGVEHLLAPAVKVTVAPGACGEATLGLIEAAVQPPIENASSSPRAGTKTIPSPVAGEAKCVSPPVETLVITAPVVAFNA